MEIIDSVISCMPNIVYFSHDHSKSLRCTSTMASRLNCTWTLASTWAELSREIDFGAKYIALHIDTIKQSGMSIKACLSIVQLQTKFTPDQQQVKVLIIITAHTTHNTINEILAVPNVHLGLDINYFPIDDIAISVQSFIKGTPYFPKHIIDQLPPARLTNVYFHEDNATYITPQMVEQFKKSILSTDMLFCATWDELDEAFAKNPHQIVFHIGMLNRLNVTISEIVSMLETRIKLAGLEIPMGVAIDPDTTLAQLKELKQAGISVIVPSACHWGVEETVTALKSLRDRQVYCPAHIVKQLPGNKSKVKDRTNEIKLTLRQEQVLDLIKSRGASNKIIAKMLKISESTVKLHITAVLKKFGAKNRTQLALFANKEQEKV